MVYLIHFARPHYHAQHYIGWAKNVEARFGEHFRGQSRVALIRAVHDAGIRIEIARTWEGGRDLERELKKKKKARTLCPVCMENAQNGSSRSRVGAVAPRPIRRETGALPAARTA